MRTITKIILCIACTLLTGNFATADTSSVSQKAIDKVVAELGIRKNDVMLTRVQPAEWPDSSLGCPEKGHDYVQVVTSGHEVEVMTSSSTYVVHVSADQVVLCEQKKMPTRQTAERDESVLKLVQRARDNLATRLGHDAAPVVVKSVRSIQTSAAKHSCQVTNDGNKAELEIVLEAAGTTYLYQAGNGRVVACDGTGNTGLDE